MMAFKLLMCLIAFCFSSIPGVTNTADAKTIVKPAENKALAYSMAEAIAAYKSLEYSRSVALFEGLTQRTPKDPLAWLYLGQSLAKLNEPQKARMAYEMVLELQPSGPQAETARQMLDAMPSINLYSLRIDSTLTLGDWLVLARKELAEGRVQTVLSRIHDLPATMRTLPQIETFQNQVIDQILAGIIIINEPSALQVLDQIDALKLKDFDNSEVARIEGRACHFLGRFSCAEAAYADWLNDSEYDDPLRGDMVDALLQARNQQAPHLFHYLPALGLVVKELPAPIGEPANPVSRLLVSHVKSRSPAESGGVQAQDILSQLGTVNLVAFADILPAMNELAVSGEFRLKVWRPVLKRELVLSLPRRPLNEDDGQREFAFKLADEGYYSRASALLNELVSADPGDDKAWHYLGTVLAKSSDIIGARRAFYRCLEAAPGGKFAEGAKKSLAELPVPDVYAIQLDSGLTLGDWLASAGSRDASMRDSLLKELGAYIENYGPIPELLTLNSKLRAELVADADRRLKEFITTVAVNSSEAAQSALPAIVSARELTPTNRALLRLHGRACHFLEDYACAERMYSLWLQNSPGSDSLRSSMVAGLQLARARKALQVFPRQLGDVTAACSGCPVLVQISGGTAEAVGKDGKRGLIDLPAFEIAKTEVTQGLWKSVMGSNPSQFQACGDHCPVENVSWEDAKEFIRRLNARHGSTFRLPTETEWEVACRAGGESDYCGGLTLDELAWYGAYSGNGGTSGKSTHPVGTRKPNPWGLYDMNGNVKEWVEDAWQDEPAAGAVPARGNRRVLRGGSWASKASQATALFRDWDGQSERYPFNGFRLARSSP